MRPTSRAFLNDYVIDQVAVGWSAMTGRMVKALAVCKKQKAKLVIAKLDRLSRNLAFIAILMDSGVEFFRFILASVGQAGAVSACKQFARAV